ncbi:MAG: hypothetical protein ACRCYT_06335 [Cetobacterium sp.]
MNAITTFNFELTLDNFLKDYSADVENRIYFEFYNFIYKDNYYQICIEPLLFRFFHVALYIKKHGEWDLCGEKVRVNNKSDAVLASNTILYNLIR